MLKAYKVVVKKVMKVRKSKMTKLMPLENGEKWSKARMPQEVKNKKRQGPILKRILLTMGSVTLLPSQKKHKHHLNLSNLKIKKKMKMMTLSEQCSPLAIPLMLQLGKHQ